MNRREAVLLSSGATAGCLLNLLHVDFSAASARDQSVPWYRRITRWGQTVITERDPIQYDVLWWRDYWKRTAVGGVIISAGGLVAYYPSEIPFHRQAQFLDGKDLYGELVQAAREDGLAVLARTDSSIANNDLLRTNPDWYARTQSGEPVLFDERYGVPCINSGFYSEYFPDIMREIIKRSRPEGFMNLGYGGTGSSICYCENCARKFRSKAGEQLPKSVDWNNHTYRRWREWSYELRTELYESNVRIARGAGGPECSWMVASSGFMLGPSDSLYDFRAISERSDMLMIDYESRLDDYSGFQGHADAGKRLNQMVDWSKTILNDMGAPHQAVWLSPESEAKVQTLTTVVPAALDSKVDRVVSEILIPAAGCQYFLSAKSSAEARLWMLEGIAGGLAPWWIIYAAHHDDRRLYQRPENVFQWHQQHARYLTNRRPVAKVGIVWSQRNVDYYGRDRAFEVVEEPYRGFMQALVHARILYVPVHASDIAKQSADLTVLILPNIGSLSDAECQAIRAFVHRGGALVASGASSLYDEWGDARADFALSDLLRAHAPSKEFGYKPARRVQTYLRLSPESRNPRDHESDASFATTSGGRHPVLRGFEDTNIVAFGNELAKVKVDRGAVVPLTFIAELPSYPAEDWWIRRTDTDIAGLVINETDNVRVAYLPADIDRSFARYGLEDHGNLLANVVRWAARDQLDFELSGPGSIDCHIYRQSDRMIVHLVNLTNQGSWNTPLQEFIPVGPLQLRLKLLEGITGQAVESLVSTKPLQFRKERGWLVAELMQLVDHEVFVIT